MTETARTPRRADAVGGVLRADRRAEIKHAALVLFAERGYAATTMTDIGNAVGMRGPSLYNHVESKQDILVDIMSETMRRLIDGQKTAVKKESTPTDQLRSVTEAHILYHLRHRLEAFVGNSEIRSLDPDNKRAILRERAKYERGLRAVVQRVIDDGSVNVLSAKIASYAILDLGMGAAVWYRADGELPEDEILHFYADVAARLVGVDNARTPRR